MASKKKEADNDLETMAWLILDFIFMIGLAFMFPLWRVVLIIIAVVVAIVVLYRYFWRKK